MMSNAEEQVTSLSVLPILFIVESGCSMMVGFGVD